MKAKTLLIILLAVLLIPVLCSCGNNRDYGLEPGREKGGRVPDGSSSWDKTGNSGNQGQIEIPAGQLTAGEWNDLANMDFWHKLMTQTANLTDEYLKRSILTYQNLDQNTSTVLRVAVSNGDNAVFNAKVELYSGANLIDTAFTDPNGRAYVFAGGAKSKRLVVTYGQIKAEYSVPHDLELFSEIKIELSGAVSAAKICQLMFVVDTTGSMHDEIDYLKAEIKDVAMRILDASPERVELQIALLFYRDHGDSYVTKYFPFSEDMDEVMKNISDQAAAGGGDFEEAVDIAFSEAVEKQWMKEASKLIIHVADAPHHYKDEQGGFKTKDNERYFEAVAKMRAKGIRVVSVASSGVDKVTEFLMRQHCMLTGGTYVFLTNHSGIGNEKIIPTVGDYVVEYLNNCLVRVASRYLLGIELPVVPYYPHKQG